MFFSKEIFTFLSRVSSSWVMPKISSKTTERFWSSNSFLDNFKLTKNEDLASSYSNFSISAKASKIVKA